MKLLFVTSLFLKKSSSASIRNLSLVNGMAELGFDVSVLTVEYPQEVQDSFLRGLLHKNVIVKSVDSGFLSKYVPDNSKNNIKNNNLIVNKAKKLLKALMYFPDIDRRWLSKIDYEQFEGYDVLISSSDTKTSHFVGKRLKELYELQWIQIWGDPWYTDINNKLGIFKTRSKIWEARLLKLADKVVYVSKPTLMEIRRIYPHVAYKSYYVPRGFLKHIYKKDDLNEKDKSVVKISYTGGLGGGRNLLPLLECLECFNRQQIQFEALVSVYGRIDKIEQQALEGFSCVSFEGDKNMYEIFEIYKSSDVLLYLGNDSKSSQIPGKLYDYFGTECQILALVDDVDSPVSQFIKSTSRCMIFENHQDKIEIAKVLTNLEKQEIQYNYSPKNIASEIIQLIERT